MAWIVVINLTSFVVLLYNTKVFRHIL